MSLHNFKSSFSFQITNLIHQEETIKKNVIIVVWKGAKKKKQESTERFEAAIAKYHGVICKSSVMKIIIVLS